MAASGGGSVVTGWQTWLTAAPRTTTQISNAISGVGAQILLVRIIATTFSGSPNITPQICDELDNVIGGASAITGPIVRFVQFSPHQVQAITGAIQTLLVPIPASFKLRILANTADSLTYSVEYQFIKS
jgi:hypothetical protein